MLRLTEHLKICLTNNQQIKKVKATTLVSDDLWDINYELPSTEEIKKAISFYFKKQNNKVLGANNIPKKVLKQTEIIDHINLQQVHKTVETDRLALEIGLRRIIIKQRWSR